AVHHAGTLDAAPGARAVPARSSLETTKAPGVTLTPRGHSQPLRAGTSRAPDLRAVLARCGSRAVNVARLSPALEPTRPLRTGTVRAPPLPRLEAAHLMVRP